MIITPSIGECVVVMMTEGHFDGGDDDEMELNSPSSSFVSSLPPLLMQPPASISALDGDGTRTDTRPRVRVDVDVGLSLSLSASSHANDRSEIVAETETESANTEDGTEDNESESAKPAKQVRQTNAKRATGKNIKGPS